MTVIRLDTIWMLGFAYRNHPQAIHDYPTIEGEFLL